ncbi:hypothetical protein SeLEV6574_g08559, partial [Synchytrium endobioticum]
KKFKEEAKEQFAAISIIVTEFMTPQKCPPPDELLDLVCCLSINAHSISNEETVNVGVGLYPMTLAMVNHSCRPNTFAFFHGSAVRLKCARPIEKGEELSLAYVAIEEPMVDRRRALKSQYLFDCFCEICGPILAGAELDARQRVLCPNSMCAGRGRYVDVGDHIQKPECIVCGMFHEKHWPLVRAEIAEARRLYTLASSCRSDQDAVTLLAQASKLLRHHSDGATDILTIRRALEDRYIQIQSWSAAYDAVQETLESIVSVYGSCGRITIETIQLLKVAKISLLVDGPRSYEWFRKASVAAEITYGRTHPLTVAAYKSLMECCLSGHS